MNLENIEAKKKVYAPMRFVNATYNFTPIQEEFIFLILREMGNSKTIKKTAKIDLRQYIKDKGLNIKNLRNENYNRLCKEILGSIVSFRYFYSSSLVHYNLFKSMYVKDFILHVEIIDEVAPLFYIKPLKQNHFLEDDKGKKLSIELFEQSKIISKNGIEETEKYSAMDQDTFLIKLEQREEKILYRKIISEKYRGKHKFEFTKEEIYMLLGCGEYVEIENTEDIFGMNRKEFIVKKYQGNTGWHNLRKKIDKWLKNINEKANEELIILENERGKGFLNLKGRPTKYFYFNVEFVNSNKSFNNKDIKAIQSLVQHYKLSRKQAENVVRDFSLEEIIKRIEESLERMKDPISKKSYYANRKSTKYPKEKIQNLSGYIYAVVFEYGKK